MNGVVFICLRLSSSINILEDYLEDYDKILVAISRACLALRVGQIRCQGVMASVVPFVLQITMSFSQRRDFSPHFPLSSCVKRSICGFVPGMRIGK